MDELAEADEFFARGDAGLYEGGPAHSASEASLELDVVKVPPTVSLARAKRRARYTRLVRRLVTGLGAFCIAVLSYRFLAGQRTENGSDVAPAVELRTAVHQKYLTASPKPSIEAVAAEPAGSNVREEDTSTPASSGSVATSEVEPVRPRAAAAPPTPRNDQAKHKAYRPARSHPPVSRSPSPPAAVPPPPPAVAPPPPIDTLPQGHEPPTARFPD